MIHQCTTLEELWDEVRAVNKKHFPENDLMPILGNGKLHRPKIMFIFINPTKRNISSSKNWKGPRFPFIGTKQVWRIFHRAGLFDDKLMQYIEKNSLWSLEFTNDVRAFLNDKSFYITNIVKWTGEDATLPDTMKIKLFLPILEREIELVKPDYIVTFGLIPFEHLTGKKIKLSEYYEKIMANKKLDTYATSSSSKIIPCYFPIGRGNPKRAVEILSVIREQILIQKVLK